MAYYSGSRRQRPSRRGAKILAFLIFLIAFIAWAIANGDPRRYKAAAEQDTPEACLQFLKDSPSSALTGAAQARLKVLDEDSWENTAVANTVDAYDAYCARFPQPVHAEDAKSRIHDLLWESLSSTNAVTPLQCDAFLRRFPNSPHAAEVRKVAQQGLWNLLAVSAKTAGEYRDYIARYPDSPHAAEATRKAQELDWSALMRDKADADAFRNFLTRYPQSPHRPQAQRMIDQASSSVFESKRRAENVREFVPDLKTVYTSVYDAPPQKRGKQ